MADGDDQQPVGLIGELIGLQRQYNEWLRAATPEQRAAAARAQLRYIASVEEDHWLADWAAAKRTNQQLAPTAEDEDQ